MKKTKSVSVIGKQGAYWNYILKHLPSDYLWGDNDRKFYLFCGQFWDGEFTKESFSQAVRDGLSDVKECPVHCDPFELLVDAKLYSKK